MGSLLQSDTQLNRQSYYEASVTRPALLAPLAGELHTDVVVETATNTKSPAEHEIMTLPSTLLTLDTP